ncbi:mismatch-specific DNA-glycosylase [Parafilimonas sp.]|uniref:mismatch-specific DNA-glycosylase n=1 Tax=Parafilimonas sp. TaxID=1969739 RepID=UPI0039E27B7D
MLKDVLTENLEVVFCGTAKGKASALKGYYYAGSGNKFYGILHSTALTPKRLLPTNCYSMNEYRIGLTDLVHTEYGNDKDINSDSYKVDVFIKKMEHYKPKFIGFTSKAAASFALGFRGVTSLINYGLQIQTIGASKIFVLPSTSGNARRFWDEKYWFELKKLIQESANSKS